MSQNQTEIAVRHTASSNVRESITAVVRQVMYRSQVIEVVKNGGRIYRVLRRQGVGRYININRPMKATRLSDFDPVPSNLAA